MSRLEARGTLGLVAAPHAEAARAGAAILAEGGSAVDAAIATNAVLGVAMPHMCGIGGDLFALVDPGDGREPVAFNASGPASMSVDADRLAARGGIPVRGLEAVTVPGAVDGWRLMHETFGRLPWGRLLADAAECAERGVQVSERMRDSLSEEREQLLRDPVSAAVYLPDGRVPEIGAPLALNELAATLRLLATAGPRALYEGDLAARITETTSAVPDGLRRGDLASYRARTVALAAARVGDHRVVSTPPNSQGATLLAMLRAIRARTDATPESIAWTTAFLEAKRIAFAARESRLARADWLDREITDATVDCLVDIGERAVGDAGGRLDGDTVALTVRDSAGATCVLIQSIYMPFGTGITVPGTGITLQNRGAYFSTAPGHPNRIGPGRSTLHTLMPILVYDAQGRLRVAAATMGADGQPQVLCQLLARILWAGENPAAALAAPRMLHGRFIVGERDDEVHVEDTFGESLLADLRRRGHRLRSHRWPAQRMGHACAIVSGPGLQPVAACDPRSDGQAIAVS